MSIEDEAKTFVNSKEKLEPVALHCNGCGVWSAYRPEYNNKLPKGWREDINGYHCNNCRTKNKRK